jgi:hypothetical protein
MTPTDVIREMRNLVNDSKGLELKRELILWSHWIEAAMEDRRRLREALDRYAEQATAEIERLKKDNTRLRGMADALEAALRQPVAKVYVHKTGGNAGIAWSAASVDPTLSLPPLADGTLLYALPPDAAGEIERLKQGWRSESDKFIAELRDAYSEIERLQEYVQDHVHAFLDTDETGPLLSFHEWTALAGKEGKP